MQRSLRAVSHIDWVMSLGIFMMFLAWFFIFIKPLATPSTNMEPILRVASEKITANTTWAVETIPLIIFSNITGTEEPLIVDFPFAWNQTNFAFSDNTSFLLDEGKILFMANITPRKTLILVHTDQNYTHTPPYNSDLTATSDAATVRDMRAEFKGGMIKTLTYRERYLMQVFNITINTLQVEGQNTSESINPLAAKYKMQSTLINHTSYVFPAKTRIYNLIRLNNPLTTPQNFSLRTTISNVTDYYSVQASGAIDYNGTCTDIMTNYIDLHDSLAGISFIFKDRQNISLCATNSTLRMSAYFTLTNDTSYEIMLHEGDYNATTPYISPYSETFGATELQQGVSYKLLAELNRTNYTDLKAAWKYPASRELAFTILNETGGEIYSYQPVNPTETQNIFAKETDTTAIDQYGKRKKVTIRVRAW
ncbi:hypothetical protein HY640_01855 [Candidatus Woesearchaeota archaeon]|nr:hypothetical protein [Candidatus Woesearchaeota archaeon]